MQRSEDGCDMRIFWSFNHSTYKTVLNLLEAIYLRLRNIVVEIVSVCTFFCFFFFVLWAEFPDTNKCYVYVVVTVVKFRVDNRGSNGTGCFRIEVRTDTARLTNMTIAGLRK